MGIFDKLSDNSSEEEVELQPNGETTKRLHKEVAERSREPTESSDGENTEVSSEGLLPGLTESESRNKSQETSHTAGSPTEKSGSHDEVKQKLDQLISQNEKIIQLLDGTDESDTVW